MNDQGATLAQLQQLITSLVQDQDTTAAAGGSTAVAPGGSTTKTALCVGINAYAPSPGGPSPLRGCVNDALLIGEMLRTVGFEVRELHDASATQAMILERLEAEIAQLRDGDYFVFWNSSHGYQVTDRSGDELFDFRDECVCTYDTDPRDPLTDDKFARILGRAPAGATIFFGSDSCHSGSITRLFRDVLTQGDDEGYRQPRLWIPPDDIRFRSGPVIDLNGYLDGVDLAAYVPGSAGSDATALRLWHAAERAGMRTESRERMAPPDSRAIREYVLSNVSRESGRDAAESARDTVSTPPSTASLPEIEVAKPQGMELRQFGQLARSVTDEEQMNHLLLAGCRPEEVSYDASFRQGFHGAMTYSFATAVLQAWRDGRAITYAEAWQAAQQGLDDEHFDQHPQLEGPQALKDAPVFGHVP